MASPKPSDGPSAVQRAGEQPPDVVVLDVMLPGYDGHEVCRRLQAERPVPVLMLTARDDEADVLVGLGVGADDYLTKPFSFMILIARLRALIRRGAPERPVQVTVGSPHWTMKPVIARWQGVSSK